MAYEYPIRDQFGQYFISCGLHQWVDVFTIKTYVDILIFSIRCYQQHKGLKVYAGVVMLNHIHMIISINKEALSDLIRDFEKFTSGIIEAIKDNPKSHKGWLLWLLRKEYKIIFCQGGYHG